MSPRIILGEGRAFVSLNFIIFDVRLYPRGGAKRRRLSPSRPPLGGIPPGPEFRSLYVRLTQRLQGRVQHNASGQISGTFDSLAYPLG